jgi:hypothetical protein
MSLTEALSASTEEVIMADIQITIQGGTRIAYGLTGRAHLFQRDGHLSDGYLREKLDIRAGDEPFAGNLIRTLIGRED